MWHSKDGHVWHFQNGVLESWYSCTGHAKYRFEWVAFCYHGIGALGIEEF